MESILRDKSDDAFDRRLIASFSNIENE
jgi:hypothetical protein